MDQFPEQLAMSVWRRAAGWGQGGQKKQQQKKEYKFHAILECWWDKL